MENDKGFIENGFIINLSNAKNTAEVIYELSSILDMPDAKNKKICLKLKDIDLTQSQLLSIKSLIESSDAELAFIDTNSDTTSVSAASLGIIISELKNEIDIPEIVPTKEDFNDLEQPDLFSGNDTVAAFQELAQEEGLIKMDYIPMDEDETPEEQLKDETDVEKMPTLYLQQTLRSGQTISYDGNIVIIGDANPGSEIIAKGDITVWGVLAGIAQAGSKGNDSAKIRALKLHAIQLRISNFYARRASTENLPFIQKTSSYTPEEASIANNQIVVKKTYEEIKEK